MAYHLDSQRIINVSEHTTQASSSHPTPHLPSRSFGFHNSERSKPVASTPHHATPFVGSPGAAVSPAELSTTHLASPTNYSVVATSSASPTGLFPGSDSPSRASKRVGISPHDEHADWDFLKNSATSRSNRMTALEPGVILSTLQRGLAHVPERRAPTEAEVCRLGTFITASARIFSMLTSRLLPLHQKKFDTK